MAQSISDSLSDPSCPIGRALFTLSNIASVDSSDTVAKSGVIETCWSMYNDFSCTDKELYMFMFLNCCQEAPEIITGLEIFSDISF